MHNATQILLEIKLGGRMTDIIDDISIVETVTEQDVDSDTLLDEDELELAQGIERKIIWQAKDFSIREFTSMLQDGDLVLQPEYQRKYVATVNIASRLIESVLMDVPIPVIYLAEEKDGSYSVIDGQQRLTSFISFINGKFPNGETFKLSGLKVYKELNKKSFSELDKEYQSKIRTTTLHTIVIKKESNEDVKFEIFERLNTGSIKLNEDEYKLGEFTDLLQSKVFFNIPEKFKYLSFRSLIPRFIRPQKASYDSYNSYLKEEKEYQEILNNSFLLGLDIEKINRKRELKETLENIRDNKLNIEKDPILKEFFTADSDNKRIDIEILSLEKKVKLLSINISNFKVA